MPAISYRGTIDAGLRLAQAALEGEAKAMGSPSAWSHRAPIVALAFAASGISVYLSLYECNVTQSVWDPIFGRRSSEAVLRSSVSRSLPVPDAVLGAAAYAAEAALALSSANGGRRRQRPLALLGVVINALAVTGVAQLLVQWLVVGRFCALCLSTAGISFLNAWLARHETAATLKLLRQRVEAGGEFQQLLHGQGE